MSMEAEIYLGVNVIWDKETNVLRISDEDNNQLALLYVTEED